MSKPRSGFVPASDLSRRDVLRQIALALTAAGAGRMSPAAAQEVHRHTEAEKKQTGHYEPKFFEAQGYKALSRLTELIVPADERSGSALDAGAPEFIDLLCGQNQVLGHIFSGGMLWLDAHMRQTHSTSFLDAAEATQIAVLTTLADAEDSVLSRLQREAAANSDAPYRRFEDYGVEVGTDLGPGVLFFDWVRKMTVDAYYTSPIGIQDLGFEGNGALTEFEVPQAVIDQALSRSPFRTG